MNNTIITAEISSEEKKSVKRTDAEKLAELYAKKNKLIEQQITAKRKSKNIDSQLTKTNGKIQEYENKALYKICNEMNITVKDIISFLEKIPKGTTLDDIEKRAFHQQFHF